MLFQSDIFACSRRFAEILQFVRNIVTNIEIGPDKTRVGLLTFSDQTVIKFHLNRYDTNKAVQDAILVVDFLGGRTNITGSLIVLIDQMFLPHNGGRANAQRVSETGQIYIFFSSQSDSRKSLHADTFTQTHARTHSGDDS